jgi:capsular exopolysaccharide synthesis family protein
VIVVTSSLPKEGKSTVATNLAVVLAESYRVLLVDADMHHPFQDNLWELTNEVGLSNVIVGKVESQLAVKQVMHNLDILTSGVSPPNPVRLLKSIEMVSLIEHFSKNYDFVLIDTPPLRLASDALILGKMKAGILLVARLGVVDSASATASKEYLEQSGQTVLGLVVNGVTQENEPDIYSKSQMKHYSNKDSANLGKYFPNQEEYSVPVENFSSTKNETSMTRTNNK